MFLRHLSHAALTLVGSCRVAEVFDIDDEDFAIVMRDASTPRHRLYALKLGLRTTVPSQSALARHHQIRRTCILHQIRQQREHHYFFPLTLTLSTKVVIDLPYIRLRNILCLVASTAPRLTGPARRAISRYFYYCPVAYRKCHYCTGNRRRYPYHTCT